jgi:predicted RecA/RadA family phage recombinase
MQNFVQADDVITVAAAPYAVAAGAGCLVGFMFGVAMSAALTGAQVVLQTEDCYDLAKKSGDTFAVGDKLYWDDTNKYLTSTSAGNKWVGVAIRAALSADTTVRTRLNGFAQ